MIEVTDIPATLAQGLGKHSCLAVGLRDVVGLFKCLPHEIASIELHRKSIDARKKDHVHFVLSIRLQLIDSLDEHEIVKRASASEQRRIRIIENVKPSFPAPLPCPPTRRPVVVGAGCAGLFCALSLAEAGLEPLLIERGDDATRRTEAIDHFTSTAELDTESNIQFGLGGAGTFSDGKLTTGTKNPAHRLILETLVEAGAPREILWDAKPHVGSDVLPQVVETIAQRIRNLGGEIRHRTRLVDIERSGGTSGQVTGIVVETRDPHAGNPGAVQTERIACDRLVLACGHSARDVFELLRQRGVLLRRKTFAMGVRIEHLQADIDRAQYGPAAGHKALGAAPYKLVAHLPNGRSLFSFCMCPGGQVVAAASEAGGVVTNGASLYARDGVNANSALLVNINPDDLPGKDVLAGVALQRSCEHRAFELGGGAYRAPAQLVGDFLARRPSTGCGSIEPTYPLGVTWCELDSALPPHVIDTLRAGIPALERRLRGFSNPEAVLTGVETRSSSPVTVVRGRDCQAEGTPGLYPCGEGAGYAGGIMSAATDGIRCAEAVVASLRDA
ncbi:FAD-dependent protein [Collinsella sp. An2]|uniref:NAD(P)/FAD-dependent oxidoreductase n=1 Tax=Collinsella sp. An2 TaxID=1965585 RepID=UPI000B38A0F6|nr:FAD-binding protein [Collinsella sp. An2]OUP08047.1 FAD-dependent oxidoreductase [Collinsella sp. An2]